MQLLVVIENNLACRFETPIDFVAANLEPCELHLAEVKPRDATLCASGAVEHLDKALRDCSRRTCFGRCRRVEAMAKE